MWHCIFKIVLWTLNLICKKCFIGQMIICPFLRPLNDSKFFVEYKIAYHTQSCITCQTWMSNLKLKVNLKLEYWSEKKKIW